MDRAVWIILNKNFSIILDGEVSNDKVTDKKFSPGNDIWTEELPQLGFSDEKIQKEYNDFLNDVIILFMENSIDKIFINAKIGEESEYLNVKNPLIIRKIEEYSLDEIIK